MTGNVDRGFDGRAWAELCDRLKQAGDLVLRGPDDPRTRAEGFRYLSRITRAALETFVENADPGAPTLARTIHETAKMGADNPDNFYFNAPLRGDREYRLRGHRGSVHYLAFATQIGHYGQGRGMPPSGMLEARELELDGEGRFEIVLSTEKKGRNWLPMKPETGTLIVRQTRLLPTEQLATLELTPLDGPAIPAPLDPARLAAGLDSTAMLVQGASMLFAAWTEGFQKHTNQLPRFDPAVSTMFGGLPEIAYYHSYWQLGPDEALVIDTPIPDCDHWNFQLNNHWMESLDYRFHRIHVNSKTASLREGPSVRVVVAHEDPGVPNWIETTGLSRGTMCFRWVRAAGEPPTPSTRVVPLREVRELP